MGWEVYNSVEKVRICAPWDGRVSPGDDSPSPRCGNVAVVALCLLRIEKCAFMAFDALATSKA